MVIDLDRNAAPVTVANFLRYVNDGFYNGLIFHRTLPKTATTAIPTPIPVIQAGGYYPKLVLKPATYAPIKLEGVSLSNVRGTIAMARTLDINSATSEFFINTSNNSASFDASSSNNGAGYTVFGTVITGLDVADAINGVVTHDATDSQGILLSNVPVTDVVINSAVQTQ